MAKRHLLKLAKDLYEGEIGKKIGEIELEIQTITRTSMVDPEEVEKAVEKLRFICRKVQNLAGALTLAAKEPEEFRISLNSSVQLCDSLLKTITDVREQEPDNQLIINCENQLLSYLPIKNLYLEVDKLRIRPRGKKREKKHIARGFISEKIEMVSLVEIERLISELREYIEENL